MSQKSFKKQNLYNGCLLSANEACWYGNYNYAMRIVSSTYAESRNNDTTVNWIKRLEVKGGIIKS